MKKPKKRTYQWQASSLNMGLTKNFNIVSREDNVTSYHAHLATKRQEGTWALVYSDAFTTAVITTGKKADVEHELGLVLRNDPEGWMSEMGRKA